jgi:maleylacetoacetate isomerase
MNVANRLTEVARQSGGRLALSDELLRAAGRDRQLFEAGALTDPWIRSSSLAVWLWRSNPEILMGLSAWRGVLGCHSLSFGQTEAQAEAAWMIVSVIVLMLVDVTQSAMIWRLHPYMFRWRQHNMVEHGSHGREIEQAKGFLMSVHIYGFWRSIASFRVRVALKLKGLPFEETPIDIISGEQFKPGYEAVNAERVVPTFIHDGHSIFQSLAIIEYLDDIQLKPRLVPEDARERAYARSLALMTVADAHPLVAPRVRNHLAKTFGADAKAIEDWGKHWTNEGLAAYERLLVRRPPAPFA